MDTRPMIAITFRAWRACDPRCRSEQGRSACESQHAESIPRDGVSAAFDPAPHGLSSHYGPGTAMNALRCAAMRGETQRISAHRVARS